MEEINSTKVLLEFNNCVQEQVLALLSKICEKKRWNYVEIIEELVNII